MEAHQIVNQKAEQEIRMQLIDPGCSLTKGTPGSSGWDLKARYTIEIPNGTTVRVPVGIALSLPQYWEAQIRPRSSSRKNRHIIEWGTIDSDYRQEIEVQVTALNGPVLITEYQRIAQIVFVPVPPIKPVYTVGVTDEITERVGGFGSTGL